MRKQKNGKLETVLIVFGLIICLVIAVGGWIIRQPYLFGQTSDGFIIRQRVEAGTPVTLVYRHSVQKTMIYEYLEVNKATEGFVLKSTKYQSLGVGLPFSQGDGDFREEDGWFIMDNMNRNFPELSIRNGVTNEEKVYVGDKEYELDAMVDSGNSLYDPVSGRPVAVAWLPETGDIPIPVGTVNERSVLYAFRPDSARLDGSDMDILVAVSKRPRRAALIPPAALCDELKITRLEGKYHA